MTVHDFQERLRYGDSAGDNAFWHKAYRQFFAEDMVSHVQTIGDYPLQRMGIDRVIVLANGRTIRIDEKKRERDYGDIALETHHTQERDVYSKHIASGWVTKNLYIDYLAYAIMPSKTVYLFDWLLLRRAFEANKAAWFGYARKNERGYSIASANNGSYWSHSICIPITDLQSAVTDSACIKL